jgi:hypothetical protein
MNQARYNETQLVLANCAEVESSERTILYS